MTSNQINVGNALGRDLSSRNRAGVLRAQIVETIQRDGCPWVLDFSEVRSVSHSFADELIAVLVFQFGEEWFKSNVIVSNCSPAVRTTILEAVQERLVPA